MKQSPQLEKVQEQMRPGIITLLGFLGEDKRNLIDILNEDEETVKHLDVTHELIAQRMLGFRDKGKRGLGEFVTVAPHFEVRVDSVRGKLPCPFGERGLVPKTNTIVRNLRLNRELVYSDMHIHLIDKHGFYEGRGSVYRLEPVDIVKILEIQVKITPADNGDR
jgi:hypothetical protein